LLGLVDAETVLAFLDALVTGRALAGLAAIDGLEERGRDLHVFLDQVVDAVRQGLTGQLGETGAGWPLRDLVTVGRRLAAIDPSRASIGGLRFQLELALLEGATLQPMTGMPVATPRASAANFAGSEPNAGDAPEAAVVSAPVAEPAALAVGPAPAAARSPEPVRPNEPVESNEPAGPGEPVDPGVPPASSPESATGARAPDSAKPVKPARPAEAAESATASPGLIELIAAWPRIVAELSSSPPIKPLVEACRPIEMTGNQVILGFPEGKAFLRDVAERRRTHLEEGIGRVLGRAVAVRLVATNLDLLPAPAAEEVDLLTMARRVFADDLVDAEEVR
jgi:hypothetical protein